MSQKHSWATIAIIAALALVIAVVLFGALESTGVFKNPWGEFGGAAAGFFAAGFFLERLYNKIENRRIEREKEVEDNDLRRTIRDLETQTDDAAETIARIYAKDIVKESEKDRDDLTGKYEEMVLYLRSLFNKQGEKWLKKLEKNFGLATLTEAHEVPELRTWAIPTYRVKPRLITDQ